jgi:glycine oxidase
MSHPDVAVIGGGVVGCATAYELARAGAQVTVIERDGIASHASGFSLGGLFPTQGAGIPGPVAAPARQAFDLHGALYPRLVDETDVDYQLRHVDQVMLARDEKSFEGLRQDYFWQKSQGFDCELVSPQDLHLLEPALTNGLAGGLLQRTGLELDSYKFTLALAQGAEKHGGRMVSAEATGTEVKGGKATGVRTRTGTVIHAGAVVIATGPWAGSPPGAGLPKLPVKPYKGEILRLRVPEGAGRFAMRFSLNGRSVGRKPDGLAWVAATEEDRGFDEKPSASARDYLMAGAVGVAPALAQAELVQHTACLRPLASDQLPIIGPLPSVADGVFAAAGAGKKGVLLSLVMAKMVAGLVLGQPKEWPVPLELSTARFKL